METLWFLLIALMLAVYVILDGFDLGAGALHLLLARTETERRSILAAIGPFWDGNEVWLLAAGGALYLAFPSLYASSFSGFYLPLMIVLWLLMLRGIGIEFRMHVETPLWRDFFDVIFSLSSGLLAVFFGAALGNVIRGVPLNSDGYFFEPLWTTFTVVPHAGILDWYTVLIGLTAFVTLSGHGANYIALKTEGEMNRRARKVARMASWTMGFLAVAGLFATVIIRPNILDNYKSHAAGLIIPVIVFLSFASMIFFNGRGSDQAAFLSSSTFIAALLAGAAFALYPNVLPASTEPGYSLTIHNSAAGSYALKVGVTWWVIGITLAAGYFVYLFRSFRGKIRITSSQ
ncbi:MAG TPA: cytochrome d ubiquinol oxidase subunit II [Acidobacteriota bacterium]|nr:cytochrome d ubiquinol oxidase subunit II [Acidobacteriota bacterium]